MFSRILSVILCLSLLLPVGNAAEVVQSATQPKEDKQAPAAAEATSSPEEAATQEAAPTKPVSPQPLSQEEEASLSARAKKPGPEVAGGALSNLHLTYIVIALAAIVLVLLVK